MRPSSSRFRYSSFGCRPDAESTMPLMSSGTALAVTVVAGLSAVLRLKYPLEHAETVVSDLRSDEDADFAEGFSLSSAALRVLFS